MQLSGDSCMVLLTILPGEGTYKYMFLNSVCSVCQYSLHFQIFRKGALKLVEAQEPSFLEVTSDKLKDYVGNPIFTSDRMYEITPPGVVMGLAWTAMGGSTLYIETAVSRPRKKEAIGSDEKVKEEGEEAGVLQSTGHLGEVMKESTLIAYTYAKVSIQFSSS